MTEDAELLTRYAAEKSEAAFTELTRRHVDLVYSAALRLLNGDVHSAQDVTQQVFTEVARQAVRLARHPALVGWLYTTTRLMALRVNRTDQRRKAREQEADTMNELIHNDTMPSDWSQLSPIIEDALHELSDKDRHAILLRFFQNKTLDEVGAGLNLSENAARMRVERALDKLREKLVRRGITTSASALAAVVSANAVQSAPAGFAASISTAAMVGSTIHASTLVTATKTIAMTTFQKTLITATIAAAVGTGIYQAHQASALRTQVQILEQAQTPPTGQIEQLTQERDEANAKLAALGDDSERISRNQAELLKLRGEVGVLRQQTNELGKLREPNLAPRQVSPDENQKSSQIWELVSAKDLYVQAWLKAFLAYAHEHQGQCPESFQQAELFLAENVRTQISRTGDQFEILYSGSLATIKDQDVIVFREKKLWEHIGGKWGRFYGIADGRAQYCSSSDKTATGNFDDYEKQHTAQLSRQ